MLVILVIFGKFLVNIVNFHKNKPVADFIYHQKAN